MHGTIKRNFKYLNSNSFVILYKGIVRSHLDYRSSVWAQYKKGDIDIKSTKKSYKTNPGINKYGIYRCLKLLPTLHYRRVRGD